MGAIEACAQGSTKGLKKAWEYKRIFLHTFLPGGEADMFICFRDNKTEVLENALVWKGPKIDRGAHYTQPCSQGHLSPMKREDHGNEVASYLQGHKIHVCYLLRLLQRK